MASSSFSLRTIKQRTVNGIDAEIQEILRQAARVYVLEAYKHVRVDTGMSRGTLVPLAHVVNVTIPISPKRSLPGKNISAGANQSFVKFSQIGSIHTFEWSANVFQYYVNERFPLRSNKNTPWRSLKFGSLKVRQYLRSTKPVMARAIRRSWTREVRSR